MSDDLARFSGQNDHQYSRERMHYLANRQYSAAESAKRQQNSWQRKFNEKHYNYKASARFNKAKAKGKALVKNLISRIYSEETTITDVSTGKTRKTNVEFNR
jgi:hypothetical protein